jgi:hypothetical protein
MWRSTSFSRVVSWSSSGSSLPTPAGSPLAKASRTKPARRGPNTASPCSTRTIAATRSSGEIVFVT